MRLIWTKSTSPLSRLIRWGLDTDCSHFAVVFDSPSGGLLFESNLLGTHPKFYRTALKHMEVVHEVELKLTVKQEDKLWDIVVDGYDDKPYDYGAFMYFSWRAFLLKCFKVPMPANNKWAKNGTFLCVELIKAIKDLKLKNINLEDIKIDPAMVEPHDLYLLIKQAFDSSSKKEVN